MIYNMKRQVVLIILDGWGFREDPEHNPIAEARTPFFDHLWNTCPHSLLEASGLAVGLPDGQMGNSEVGHTTIGAGTALDTDLVRISKSAVNDEFQHVSAFKELFDHVKKYDSVLHVKGLIGPGGIHSHSDHLYAFLKTAKKAGVEKIAIHAFLDGRDTRPQSAHKYLEELESVIKDLGVGFIATATGRFYGMDRDNNWDRIKRAEDAIFKAVGKKEDRKASEIVRSLYLSGVIDEHVEPIVFLDDNGKSFSVQKNDGVFFFNFRSDRARQLSKKISEKKAEMNLCFVTFTEYEKDLGALIAFPPKSIETTLAAEISKAKLTQAHIAETEKFAHATYFLNGGREAPHENERHELIESRRDIKTHDQAPEMKAKEITDKAIECLEDSIDFIFINYANADMVGHTANKEAIVAGIEALDFELKRLMEEIIKKGAVAFITADHGNAEISFDKFTQTKHTAHTINPVPAILVGEKGKLNGGSLRDIAPTILNLFCLKVPQAMTGKNLFTFVDL